MMRRDIDRREFLKKSVAAAAVLAFPNIVLAKKSSHAPSKTLSLYNIHTSEKVEATFWENGRYLQEEIERLNHLLRDFRTGDVHPMDTALFETLHDLKGAVGSSAPFHIISGYRSPKTNNALRKVSSGVAKRSLHMQGRAIDLNLPGTRLDILRLAARELRRGGVGYYPKSGFIHLDTGRIRYW